MPWDFSVIVVVFSLVGFAIYRWYRNDKEHSVPSPLQTLLPQLTPSEIRRLPYPPDALPGARDVESPCGSLRVYEWGPTDGAKVLLVHGISTPSIGLGVLYHHHVQASQRG